MTRTRISALSAFALTLGALFFAASASAALPTETGNPIECSGTPAGSCVPGAVAVDEASGDIYMIDLGNGAIDRFDAEGNYLSQIAGVFAANEEDGLAVDNSGGPNQGRLYYGSYSLKELFAYSPGESGNQELWHTADGLGNEPCGVAVDAAGSPWVGSYDLGVQQHSPADGAAVGGYVATDHPQFGPPATCRLPSTRAATSMLSAGTDPCTSTPPVTTRPRSPNLAMTLSLATISQSINPPATCMSRRAI